MKFMVEVLNDSKQVFPPFENAVLQYTEEKSGMNVWGMEINTIEELVSLIGDEELIFSKIDSGADMDYCITVANF